MGWVDDFGDCDGEMDGGGVSWGNGGLGGGIRRHGAISVAYNDGVFGGSKRTRLDGPFCGLTCWDDEEKVENLRFLDEWELVDVGYLGVVVWELVVVGILGELDGLG